MEEATVWCTRGRRVKLARAPRPVHAARAMSEPSADARFSGSIPELYGQHLVPFLFAPYAEDLARRATALSPSRVLETAAGTGVVTRALSEQLPHAQVVATDLNPPMLERAARTGTARPVTWQSADAGQLPFPEDSFDLVLCQFGVMFFPDKVGAFREARRVLRPGGSFLFNVWRPLERNPITAAVTAALAAFFPADPPRFLARVPHGYCDEATIARHLAAAGFTAPPRFEVLQLRSGAPSAQVVALAFCQGTPVRAELEARGAPLDAVTAACEAALVERFGAGPLEGPLEALVVQVER
jgi:SAM-dependent methyltransferase